MCLRQKGTWKRGNRDDKRKARAHYYPVYMFEKSDLFVRYDFEANTFAAIFADIP